MCQVDKNKFSLGIKTVGGQFEAEKLLKVYEIAKNMDRAMFT
ncbi:hypothetical protein [Ruminiclostridium hungatei]